MRKLLEGLTKYLDQPNTIYDHIGKAPYLSRYYLLRRPRSTDGSRPFDQFGRPKDTIIRTDGWGLVLHKFHQSDSTTLMHNHGWTWGLSFILAGGYSEEKLIGDKIIRRTIKPLSFNFIRPHEFHRVDLIEEDAWTIFLVGPRTKEWSYKERESEKTIPWNQHVKMGEPSNANPA